MAEPSADDLKALANARLTDAQHLLAGGRHSAAYYLAGYAVECALKAIIARSFRAGVIPSRTLVNQVYTHQLDTLLRLSGLEAGLNEAIDRSVDLNTSWSIVSSWSEASRYEMIDPFRSTAMVDAVGDTQSGVLQWLRQHW
jgi:HEPN domain-containing protein